MIKQVTHIGLTVTDLDRSIEFYTKVLGLEFKGELLMEGPATEALFCKEGIKARVAYVNSTDDKKCPPIELIQFIPTDSTRKDESDLFKTSISEVCFEVEDIDGMYEDLKSKGVEFLSAPQSYDFTEYGFGKSKAVYLKDPDGIILEFSEYFN